MKTNEITENNKLIAEFLELLTKDNEGNIKEDINFFNFHTDWNWLMKVVEKIESLNMGTLEINSLGNENDAGFDSTFRNANVVFRIEYKDVHIDLVGDMQIWEGWKNINKYNSKIEAVYNACVEFIKWYNSQPSQIGFDENGDNVITR